VASIDMAGWLPAYRSQSLVGVLDRHGEGRGEAKANPKVSKCA